MNKRVRSSSGNYGTVLEISNGWVKVLWDGKHDVGPVDYHAPFTRGVMALVPDDDPFDGAEEFRLTRADVEAMEAAAVEEMARCIDEIADYDPSRDEVV